MNNQRTFCPGFGARKLAVAGMLAASLYLCLLPVPTGAQIPVQEWVRTYGGPGVYDANDYPRAIAVDTIGNVYVAGDSRSGYGSYDSGWATLKYSNAGLPLWTNFYSLATHRDYAQAMALDDEGSVIVTGETLDNGEDYFATVKYSSEGAALWTNLYSGGKGQQIAHGVTVDSSGSVYVTGASGGADYKARYATIKYSGGGVALWTNYYNGPGTSETARPSAIAVDSSGSVFVTGGTASRDYSYFTTIKYSNAGTPLWTNLCGGPGNSGGGGAIAVDTSGTVYVAGGMINSSGGSDYATIAYSGAGLPLWTNRHGSPVDGEDERLYSMAVDANGNVFMTGYRVGNSTNLPDYATIAYSGAGVPLWTNSYDGPGNSGDLAVAMAVGADGAVYVTGTSTDSDGSSDYATIAYSGAGVPLWTNRYSSLTNYREIAQGIAVDRSGNVFVTGTSHNGTNRDYATVKYAAAPRPSLRISTVGTEVRMAWPSSVNGWALRRAPVVEGPYIDPALSVTLEGSDWVVYDAINGGARFYRLQKLP